MTRHWMWRMEAFWMKKKERRKLIVELQKEEKQMEQNIREAFQKNK